jgi:hypothetical protein
MTSASAMNSITSSRRPPLSNRTIHVCDTPSCSAKFTCVIPLRLRSVTRISISCLCRLVRMLSTDYGIFAFRIKAKFAYCSRLVDYKQELIALIAFFALMTGAAAEPIPCWDEPAQDGQEWHYRTRVDGELRRCWYVGERMKPRKELYWRDKEEPIPLPLPRPAVNEEFEDRWRGEDSSPCADITLPQTRTPGRDMFVWEGRQQLQCFCQRRPFYRDCHNLRNPLWDGDR